MLKDTTTSEKIVISLGGSLIVPNGGINIPFLKDFNRFIRSQLEKNPHYRFFIVVGGGATARHYIDAGRDVLERELTSDDLDWLGIHVTRLNAHLIRTIFRDIAHPVVLDNYEIIRKADESIVVGAGWKPGWSTDYCAAMICEDYNVQQFINLSNIEKVYDKDPKENPDAKPIDKISWMDFQKIVGEVWIPGMSAPFDPIATKKSKELGLKVVILKGDNFENLHNYFDGKDFVGTIIEG